jgi:sarcosine oxidase subunit gamma
MAEAKRKQAPQQEAPRELPLEGRMFAANGVRMEPEAQARRISLRAGAKALPALGKALGVKLPVKPKNSASADGVAALWLGPDEWLLIAPAGADLVARLSGVTKQVFSAVDISHRNTGIEIDGPKAALALSSGVPQDLSLAAFPVGACSRTILAKAEIVLFRTGETAFRVECWRSFSDYVWNYLADAAKSA